MKICRVGLVGCGGIGKVHLSAYERISNAKVVAVADVDKQRAVEAAQKVNADAWYEDYGPLLKRADIDMVDVCLPVYLHPEAVTDAAKAGKHVLCEKPICTSLKDADEMIKATRGADVKFMIAFMYRFDPLYVKVKEYINNGTIGTPILMWLTNMWRPGFMEPSAPRIWFAEKEKSGGMLVEHVCHWLDQFRWWSGEGESVFAQVRTFGEGIDIEDNASLTVKFRNNAFLSITQSWHSYLRWNNLGVVGENGSAEMSNEKVLRVRSRGQPTEEIRIQRGEQRPPIRYQREIEHFVKCVLDDEEPIVSGEDGRAALEFAIAAHKSAEKGRPVFLPLSS